MTYRQSITNPDYPPRSNDPALVALDRMRAAGEDDQRYETARVSFVNATPNTLAGVSAKHESLAAMLVSMREGDEFAESGWDELFTLFGTAAEGLKAIVRQDA